LKKVERSESVERAASIDSAAIQLTSKNEANMDVRCTSSCSWYGSGGGGGQAFLRKVKRNY
jgi:hypothetical protein